MTQTITPREQAVLDAVDKRADAMLDFLTRLVAQPSVLGNEAGAVDVAEAEMRALGFAPTRVPIDPEALAGHPGFAPVLWEYEPGDGRDNLVAVVPGTGGGRSALFDGHLDVVSHEPGELWSTDPFEPVVRDGWMHGRGAGDMKSGVAAMLHAARAIDDAGLALGGDLTLETVIEEECCGNGALACRAAGYDADAALIPEPFGPTLLTHQVGVLWFLVRVTGSAGHVLDTAASTDAIEKSYALMAALRELEAEMNAEPRPTAYADHPHPLNLNIGVFESGDWPSTVPAKAEFHGRLSYFPGTPFEEVRSRIEAAVHKAAQADPWLAEHPPEVIFHGFRSDGHSLNRDTPALAALSGCHEALTGRPAQEYIATCTTDLRAFAHFGRAQATCFGPVAENIHGADERVDVASILHTARAYALFLCRWCGISE